MISFFQLRSIFKPINFLPPILLLIIKKFKTKILPNGENNGWNKKPIDYSKIFKIFSQKVVLNGPFKGMRYPRLESNGSSLYPKLLGSYELEIQSVINNLISLNFDKVFDIGSAEGYYAVGFGLKSKSSKIYAFDVNKNAVNNCKKMAEINGVYDRIIFGEFCSKATLLCHDLSNSLIISDCEGYEGELFLDKKVLDHLKSTTLLIETHNHFDINISNSIKLFFNDTHVIYSYNSVDDIFKLLNYDFNEINNLDTHTKFAILEEGRGYSQEWLLITPLSNN